MLILLISDHPFFFFYRAFQEPTTIMNERNGRVPKLDLKLNLSPPRVDRRRVETPPPQSSRSATVSPTSPLSSCLSTELIQDDNESVKWSNSPEATFMVVVGCQRCLMYVMLSVDDPKCPKCKSTVLLDVHQDIKNIRRS